MTQPPSPAPATAAPGNAASGNAASGKPAPAKAGPAKPAPGRQDAAIRNVLWITSYPKSGNTWVGSALKKAGRRHGDHSNEIDAYVLQATGQVPVVNDAVHPRFRDRPCSVLKTHSAFSPQGQPHHYPGLRLRTVGYIHVYRNPLDVLLSYIGYTRLEYKANLERKGYPERLFLDLLGFERPFSYEAWLEQSIDTIPQANLDHALDRFSDAGLAIPHLEKLAGSWASHQASWRNAPPDLPGHSVRYEDCVADEAAFDPLADMFAFSPEELREAVRSVNQVARQVSVEGNQDQVIFYNKMRAYYFQDYFSKAAIARFCERHRDILERTGYGGILDMA